MATLNEIAAESPIVLPAQKINAGDLMDAALDKLRTIHLALSPENRTWHDAQSLAAVWATVDEAIRDLMPVRNRLQGVEGGDE
ncbi:hypothetical protein NK718_12755 [Alsobacter sp. SYSU M60028]|uniref:Uncharacterized protein n=1 Tax=Alsobacter ponti TaxID=2962936 RepID=A0ABT1LD04_9HYPH|nr:hypothetical protein [Alsobacter ponti]MCP8939387.1 hypothetical protein [Alsobacter ponti]